MKPPGSTAGRNALDGTIHVFLAEALVLPTGLVTTAFLTRRLGTDAYGLFTLAATCVAWIEWTVAALFTRATYKSIGEARDWRPVATTVIRLHLAVSVAAAILLASLAGPIAAILGEKSLAGPLRLFAIDIPIFSLGYVHRNLLVGIGAFRRRAMIGATRWLARLALILVLVGMGLSVTGAILASIGTSLVELAIARRLIKPSLFQPTLFPAGQLLAYAAPLFLYTASMRAFDKLDLFMLKALGGTMAAAGAYGVAQNLSIVPGIFAMSFSPLLLSTLIRLTRDGEMRLARDMGRDAMRLVILLVPFAGMTAGAAGEIVRAISGPRFAGAAPPLAVLIFGALAMTMIGVTAAILTAASKLGWPPRLTIPLIPLVLGAHWILIPRFGALGAAAGTAGCAILGALASIAAVRRVWSIAPPLPTLLRSALLCCAAFAIAALWPANGLLLVAKLCAIAAIIALGYWGTGEFSAREIALARSFARLPGSSRGPV